MINHLPSVCQAYRTGTNGCVSEVLLSVKWSPRINFPGRPTFTLCNQIISSPDSGFTKSLIKLLNNLTLTKTDFVKLRELKRLQEQMAAVVKEKLALRDELYKDRSSRKTDSQ